VLSIIVEKAFQFFSTFKKGGAKQIPKQIPKNL